MARHHPIASDATIRAVKPGHPRERLNDGSGLHLKINLEAAEWRIPAEKMKARVMHIVPLSTQAVGILSELRPLTGKGRWVFPGLRTNGER